MRKSKTPGNGELNDHVSFWIGFLFSNSGWLKEQVLNNPYDIRPNLLHAAQMHFLFVLSTAFHSRLERISAKSQPQDDPGRKRRAIWKSAQTLERNWKTFQLFEACFAVCCKKRTYRVLQASQDQALFKVNVLPKACHRVDRERPRTTWTVATLFRILAVFPPRSKVSLGIASSEWRQYRAVGSIQYEAKSKSCVQVGDLWTWEAWKKHVFSRIYGNLWPPWLSDSFVAALTICALCTFWIC